MADNLRRGIQDIDLGVNDTPVILPTAVVNQAAEENKFIIIGKPVMPRKQNLRSIVALMPRYWGQSGLVFGRIVEGRHFQFVFPTEESLQLVLRRGPWAFADRMLVLERWTPTIDPLMLNFIPFWIQIRGIPVHFLNVDVITSIGEAMGNFVKTDYVAEEAARVEFVRVQLNWNIDEPLKFQRNFQFTPGHNTLLKFTYERLRGFCEVCGFLTHDSGNCLIQNGGPDQHLNGDDNDDDNVAVFPEIVPNQGVILEDINDDAEGTEEAHQGDVSNADQQMENENIGTDDVDAEPFLFEEFHGNSSFGNEQNMEKMFNPFPFHPIYGKIDNEETRKRKFEEETADMGPYKVTVREHGESSGTSIPMTTNGGAVGPEPPLPP
ncbi:hypothetical protein AALP_AA2G110500 [Arabis alpina]|uniref:DUF4283 domain-containing protein n=1 Tax=Arabis alpina TaxID=50452 RepID=A0A087HGN6_ARAAL|nr:hypothetical protein AALP_AA2G110500 [Arabis alpina]